jgi:hypothetical protein
MELIKRIILIVLLLISPLFFIFSELDNFFIFAGYGFLLSCVILWTFPQLLIKLHSKQKTIEDLKLSERYDIELQYKFQQIFNVIMIICFSCFMISISIYFKYKFQQVYGIFEGLAIIYSLKSLYNSILNQIGKYLIAILYYFKLKYYPSVIEIEEIEMNDISISYKTNAIEEI